MLNSELIQIISRRLRDVDERQWVQSYLVDALNAAFTALCTVIPQAYTVHRDLNLVEGTEQHIDDDLHRILHILHNVCPNTGKPLRTIVKTDLSVLDRSYPHWRRDLPRGYIWHYMSNPVDESMFYNWPPVGPDGLIVRGVFTKTPCVNLNVPEVPDEPVDPGPLGGDVTQQDIDDFSALQMERELALAAFEQFSIVYSTLNDEVPFDHAHTQAIIEYAIYYAHARDDEQTANSGRAMQHFQNFFQLLNKREDAELLVKSAEGDSE